MIPAAGLIVTATPEAPVFKGLSIPSLTVPAPLRVNAVTDGTDTLMFVVPAPLCVRVVRADIEAPMFVMPVPLCVRLVVTVWAALMFNVPELLLVKTFEACWSAPMLKEPVPLKVMLANEPAVLVVPSSLNGAIVVGTLQIVSPEPLNVIVRLEPMSL